MSLVIWTIYDHPTDFPDDFVARPWIIANGGYVPADEAIADPDLDVVRMKVANWLKARGVAPTRLNRAISDPPQILEVWL